MKLRSPMTVGIGFLSLALICSGQSKDAQGLLADRALQEYRSEQYAAAERDCREIVKQNPSNIVAQVYLGQSLYMQKKYAESVPPFEKARELEAGGMKLNSDQHRIVIDQLVIAYGISGNLKKVHALLDDAIRQDPDYPLNYYNLACAFAGEGNKAKLLENLSLAFERRDHMLKGEHMPDPRTDDSFQNYLHDADFGSGYQVATLGHILHSEGEVRGRKLLKKVYDSLASGGTIAIGEFLVNRERTGPVIGLFFAVNMLVNTEEGDTFTFGEYRQWLEGSRFGDVRTLDVPAPSPVIIATKV